MELLEAAPLAATASGQRRGAGERRFRIVGIAQVYNEIRKGNIHRFVDHILPVVDELVVYDDASTDGTLEYVMAHTPHVIRGCRNEFDSEIAHKQQLLERALTLNPDFILWLDADEVLTAGAAEALQHLCASCIEKGLDGIALHELNLWRSRTWRRTDSLYDDGWFVRLWRVTSGMHYRPAKGLHLSQHPVTVRRIARACDPAVLHYGFSDERNLAHKYLTYRAHGKRGYEMLGRLIDEEQLVVERVAPGLIPEDLQADELAPTRMTFAESLAFVEAYREQYQRPGVSLVCLLPQSRAEAWFCCEQVLGFTDMSAKELLFVVDGRRTELLDSLRGSYLPCAVWNGWTDDQPAHSLLRLISQVTTGDLVLLLDPRTGLTLDWFDALFSAYSAGASVSSRPISRSPRSGWPRVRGRGRSELTVAQEGLSSHPTADDAVLGAPILLRADDLSSGLAAHRSAQGARLPETVSACPDALALTLRRSVTELVRGLGLDHRVAANSVVRMIPPVGTRGESRLVAGARQPVVRVNANVPADSESGVWRSLVAERAVLDGTAIATQTGPSPREVVVDVREAGDADRQKGAHLVVRVSTTDSASRAATRDHGTDEYLVCQTQEEALQLPETECQIVDSPESWRHLLEKATQWALSQMLATERERRLHTRYVRLRRTTVSSVKRALGSLRPSRIRYWLQDDLAPILRAYGLLEPALMIRRVFRFRMPG